jgi:hypothetical protein
LKKGLLVGGTILFLLKTVITVYMNNPINPKKIKISIIPKEANVVEFPCFECELAAS